MTGKIVVILLAAVAVINLCVLLTLQLIGYQDIKAWLDALSADGTASAFNETRYNEIKLVARMLTLVLILACTVALVHREKLSNRTDIYFRDIAAEFFSFAAEFKRYIKSISPSIYVSMVLIIVLGGIVRLYYLDMPIRNDEAFTFLNYVDRPFLITWSLYDTSNNHMLFSMIGNLTIRLLGPEEWSLRLPVVMAGILLIPAVFMLAKSLFNSACAGLLAAGLVSGAPYFVEYSINARGYTFVCLFTSIMLIAASNLIRRPDSKIWNLMYSFSAAAGLASMPIMAYPLAMSVVWIVARQMADKGRHGLQWLSQLFRSLMIVAALTLIWYAPSLLTGGWRTLLQIGIEKIKFVEWLPQNLEKYQGHLFSLYGPLPLYLMPFALVIFLLGARRVPWLLLSYTVLPLIFALQHVVPFVRVLMFLAMLTIVIFAGGLESLILSVSGYFRRISAPVAISLVAVVLALAQTTYLIGKNTPPDFDRTNIFPEAAEVVTFLNGKITDRTPVISGVPSDVPMMYYGKRLGMERMCFLQAGMVKEFYDSLWVLENPRSGKCLLEKIVADNGLDTLYNRTPRLIKNYGTVNLYLFEK